MIEIAFLKMLAIFFSVFYFCYSMSLGYGVTDVKVLLVTWNTWSELVNEQTCQGHFGHLSHR